ncbi:lysozyme-like domain-containing protein [Obelidium mucronatum]|nr:lysozyme-like domain-containing protein [Obelidium mucronatum]
MVTGFVAPISGLKELAILLGNCAHESAKFTITTEIGCRNNPSACPYGWFYGRGYLQLSWEQNYLAAAKALGNPQIYSNPDIVAYDETVNWSTVQWFWQTIVQPQLRSRGMSLASSVYAINGKLECKSQGGGGIAPQRLSMTQCFEAQLGVEIDTTDWC